MKVIDELLSYSGLNAKSFSEKIGLERPQAIYDIQKGKTKNISQSMTNKILSVFPEINRVWLLTGEGEMLNNQTINATNSTVVGSNIKGNGNQIMHNDLSEIKMLVNEMAEQRKASSVLIQKKDEQIDRLLSIVEKFQK